MALATAVLVRVPTAHSPSPRDDARAAVAAALRLPPRVYSPFARRRPRAMALPQRADAARIPGLPGSRR